MPINYFYLGVFIIYLASVLAIGAWGYLRTDSVEDFWVYGKNLGPLLATWSLIANFVSAASVIGYVGSIYTDGYSIMTGIVLGLLLGLSGLYFVVHKLRELDHITFTDIVVDVIGYESARPVVGTILLANAWLYLIIQLTGAAVLVNIVTGVPYEYMIWVLGGTFILYTVFGGLVSVAWTDLVQGTIMVGMVAIAFVYMVFDFGGLTTLNTQFASLNSANVQPLGDGTYTVIGILGTIIAFFGTAFTTQSHMIRINATDSIRTAKLHIAAAGVILSLFYVMLIFLGGGTVTILDQAGVSLSNPDAAFPTLITEYVPTSVGVFITLAILSGILSTTDSRLHACGITVAHDIYDYLIDGNKSDDELMRVSRGATITFGLAATAVAVNPPGTIIQLYELRAVLLTSALLLPVYITLYNRYIDGRAVILSIVLGSVFGLSWQLTSEPLNIPATFVGVGAAALGLFVGHHLWTNMDQQVQTEVQ